MNNKLENSNFDSENESGIGKFDTKKFNITSLIGSGDDAKNSIAFLSLKWCFISLLVIFIGVSLYSSYKLYIGKEESYLENLLKGTGIITPIITLILGYVFGRSSDKSNN